HYAQRLRQHVRTVEPGRLVDTLIVGALIEARSCERFASLAPHPDPDPGELYRALLTPGARHQQDYLKLDRAYADGPIDERVAFFAEVEGAAVVEDDREFRFHSGALAAAPAILASGS